MSTPTRILMTGSRDWTNRERIEQGLRTVAALALVPAGSTDVVLVHGADRGADTLAADVASQLGWATEAHPADWDTYGESAGPRRNREMIAAGAQIVVGFPIGRRDEGASLGTWECLAAATTAGLPAVIVWGDRLFPFDEHAARFLAQAIDPFNSTRGNLNHRNSVPSPPWPVIPLPWYQK